MESVASNLKFRWNACVWLFIGWMESWTCVKCQQKCMLDMEEGKSKFNCSAKRTKEQ